MTPPFSDQLQPSSVLVDFFTPVYVYYIGPLQVRVPVSP